ncbi:HAD family phosphatase [Pseudomonas capsici]|uniref:HAD family phosphatase n=1 Tax=Pseudomonas capsici TaxID=2810614 RepID=A0ABT3BTZ7_9PSED|nr:HAD family phosphatase [Pseudomonas capsici]MBN6715379.1 HAD family phosphatase [Pseudomonas capsici]MBN6720224.1 HAD family phosphatase [Pseudomonas capsici]MBN6725281.1 HAD family phosphatase [Pseudomonas capsici]MCV4267949.1 HAD family phosphatase [Pseudomonas capsici]MCV4276774.1 HAD family phosphatase [Pseudomonas capsici]
MLAPVANALPDFPALLFGLSGCLVDFGAQAGIKAQEPDFALATPGAMDILQTLSRQGMPCAWIDELPENLSHALAATVSEWITPAPRPNAKWPAPDACWLALMALKVNQLEGCVLISGDPRLLQSGLNAGLWTIGLASCGPLCGLSPKQWQALNDSEREQRRAHATLKLYAQGVHSVIDHLGELESCLADIALRRSKGEKP